MRILFSTKDSVIPHLSLFRGQWNLQAFQVIVRNKSPLSDL